MCHPRIYSALFLLLTLAPLTSAQDKGCTTKLSDLPQADELRGFRLGMTPEQVKARVPQVVFGHKDDLGVSKTSINPDFDPRIDKSNFADVRTVSLDFLDGRVTSLWIGYESSFKWKTVDEFVKGISHELALPEGWLTRGRAQQLRCADFQVSVSLIAGGPSLRIVDMPAEEMLVARRQAKEDASSEAAAAVTGDSKNKTYYPNDCQSLSAVPEKNRVAFSSAEEAEKAGYKKAEACN